MLETSTKFGIVVGVDGSPGSDAAVSWAAREASLRGEIVTLMHVVQPVVVSWPVSAGQASVAEWQDENARQAIDRARKGVDAVLDPERQHDVRSEVLYSHPVDALVDASKDARMIVVGSHGRGALGRLLMGSVSRGVAEHSHCVVAVIHASPDPRPDDAGAPILLGIDGSPASEAATAWAFEEASRRAAPLIALHAWSDVGVFPIFGMDWRDYQGEGEEVLAERLAGWQEHYPDVHLTRRLVCDTPAHWLLEESQRSQLVVVGSHGRGGFGGMRLGSVSAAIAQSATVPVIVVRTP
ncbi:universal stress protein [Mycobacterium cookii]|uniref:Universal stress protein n=1 Tax=Mycobacterium cookii TaxID=1775 RepID=A0A7I7KW02_9MYCO|nr:universal stress protein [Mycobacterium cookii]MCV7329950.1 universal stress protein [Mycobacterium cookii]BBX45879.1 universal stress protein [Mycobacterium cookii]